MKFKLGYNIGRNSRELRCAADNYKSAATLWMLDDRSDYIWLVVRHGSVRKNLTAGSAD